MLSPFSANVPLTPLASVSAAVTKLSFGYEYGWPYPQSRLREEIPESASSGDYLNEITYFPLYPYYDLNRVFWPASEGFSKKYRFYP